MELDSRNFKRLLRVWRRSLKRNYIQIILYFISYMYLYIGYIYIVLFVEYNIGDASRPIGYFLMLSYVILYYLIYILVNHIVVRRIVKHKTLFIFETLLFLSLVSIIVNELQIPIEIVRC